MRSGAGKRLTRFWRSPSAVAEAGIEPMSMEEIDREVKAVRAERRRRAGGR